MRTLVYDTETTGLVDNKHANDYRRQPHLVQLAAVLAENGVIRKKFSLIVDPGVPIPSGAAEVHGIDNGVAQRYGVSNAVAVAIFHNHLKLADRVVAHNGDFDVLVMRAAYARANKPADLLKRGALPTVCTMKSTIELVNLPPTQRMIQAGFNKPKPPKLEELHEFLFGEGFDGAHDALVDVEACYRCLVELEKRGVPLIGGEK